MRLILLLLAFACCHHITQAQSAPAVQNIFDLEHSTSFAKHLLVCRQYDLAASEYERIVFMQPDSDSLKYALLRSYRLAGKPNFAFQRYQQLYSSTPSPSFINKEAAKSLLSTNELPLLKQYVESTSFPLPEDRSHFLFGYHFLSNQWTVCQQLTQQSPSLFAPEYHNLIQEALHTKKQSPYLAAGLSAVIPGMGKVYCGRWKDGLFSTIIIGSMGWRTYRFFDKKGKSSALGWIFGGVTAGFYIGNIWGSAQAAKAYNHHKKHMLHEKMSGYILDD